MPALLTSTSSPPNDLDGLLDQPPGAVPVGDVVGVGHGDAAGRLDLVDHRLRGPGVGTVADDGAAQVVDHDVGALAGQLERVARGRCRAPPR